MKAMLLGMVGLVGVFVRPTPTAASAPVWVPLTGSSIDDVAKEAANKATKAKIVDSSEWFHKEAMTAGTNWAECASTFCKDVAGDTEVFSHAARHPTQYLRRSNGPVSRASQSRNRARLNDNDNFNAEHWHCELDTAHLHGCRCMCSPDTNCYSVKHSDRFVKKCDGQAAEVQYTASNIHKGMIAAVHSRSDAGTAPIPGTNGIGDVCATGTYNPDGIGACVLHTTCSADQYLTGQSATAPGNCVYYPVNCVGSLDDPSCTPTCDSSCTPTRTFTVTVPADHGGTCPYAHGATISGTTVPALTGAVCARSVTDQDVITLTAEGGAKLDWSGSGRISTSPSHSQWKLKKCTSGDCTSGALGSAAQWTTSTSAASVLKTCDVVAWYNTFSGKVYDCAGGTCSQQPFPLPSGHWGSPYKIRKDGTACGQEIATGDAGIYFSRMVSGNFVDTAYLSCTVSSCGGTTDGTKTSFTIAESTICENSCSPDGSLSSNSLCNAQYCNQYEPGAIFHGRCTAGNPNHNYAVLECQKTCGIC